MHTSIFAVSDLHLGGELGAEMCSAEGRARLAEFLRYVATCSSAGGQVHLVLAGDVVDFLAEENDAGGWDAFTEDEPAAVRKFRRIVDHTADFWPALRTVAVAGVRVTILLGNHDVELSYPNVRRHLLDLVGPGRVEFVYDNEALRIGPVVIEHGNRYDPWNAVAHDALRRRRSTASRREPSSPFPVQPGSELVARVMNRIKGNFPFVDLLKPETSATLPILAVLDPGAWMKARDAIGAAARAAGRKGWYDDRGVPTRNDLVAGETPTGPHPREDDESTKLRAADEEAFRVAASLAEEADAEEASTVTSSTVSRRLLLRALRYWAAADNVTWNVEAEAPTYDRPARALLREASVVVFGHTHLAKQVRYAGGGLYMNLGTWADLIRLPPAVLNGSEADGLQALDVFLMALRGKDLSALRRPVPTFGRITLDGSRIADAGVYFFDKGGGVEPLSTAGVAARLGVEG